MIAQMTDLVQVGTEWGIDFRNAAGEIVDSLIFVDEAEFDAMFAELDDPHHWAWPADAADCDTWTRPVYELVPLVQPQRRNPLTGRFLGGGR